MRSLNQGFWPGRVVDGKVWPTAAFIYGRRGLGKCVRINFAIKPSPHKDVNLEN